MNSNWSAWFIAICIIAGSTILVYTDVISVGIHAILCILAIIVQLLISLLFKDY